MGKRRRPPRIHWGKVWNFGRLGVCAGLKILRTWFDSTRFHSYSGVLQRQRERTVNPPSNDFVGSSPTSRTNRCLRFAMGICMEDVAQWVERQIVALMVAGSNPVILPNSCAVTSPFRGMIFLKAKAPSQALKRGEEPSFFVRSGREKILRRTSMRSSGWWSTGSEPLRAPSASSPRRGFPYPRGVRWPP